MMRSLWRTAIVSVLLLAATPALAQVNVYNPQLVAGGALPSGVHATNMVLTNPSANQLSITGNLTVGGGITVKLGSPTSVALGPSANAGTGMYFPNANQVSLCGNTVCGLTVNGAGSTLVQAGLNVTVGGFLNNGVLLISQTAPTIASGGCTTGSVQSISASNGSAAFEITLGGATCGSTITLTMPAAAHNWVCDAHDITTPAGNVLDMTGTASTTAVVLTNFVRTTGAAGNFGAADVLAVKCLPY